MATGDLYNCIVNLNENKEFISIQRETTQLILENLGMREKILPNLSIFFIEIPKYRCLQL